MPRDVNNDQTPVESTAHRHATFTFQKQLAHHAVAIPGSVNICFADAHFLLPTYLGR
jgi:hypothetical protein